MRISWLRAGTWATAGVLGAGLLSGITWAAASSGSPSAAPSSSSSKAGAGASGHGRHHRGLMRRLEHGELTVRAKKSDTVVDVQRGRITAVSGTSVTVASRDGYTGSYTFADGSKVRVDRAAAAIGALKAGDRVRLVAAGGQVRRIAARPAPAAHPARTGRSATPRPSTPAGATTGD